MKNILDFIFLALFLLCSVSVVVGVICALLAMVGFIPFADWHIACMAGGLAGLFIISLTADETKIL